MALTLSILPPFAAATEPGAARNDLLLIAGMADLREGEKLSFGVVQARFAPDYHGIRPYSNLGWASGGSTYVGAGLFHNFELPRHLRLTLGTGPGYYRHRGNVSNLGYAIEFYSWIELSAVVLDKRIGLSVGHLSNAHLGSRNPGTEDVSLSASVLSW
jgi:hypothetical protein